MDNGDDDGDFGDDYGDDGDGGDYGDDGIDSHEKQRRTQQGCYFGYHEPSGWIMMTMMVILVMIMAMMVSIHTKSRGELSKAATSDIMNLQVGWSL